MRKKDTFSTYHPLISFLYFGLVLGCSMVFMHPVCLAISLFAAFSYSIYLNGTAAIKHNLIYMIPMLLFTTLMNPLFNHEGGTILGYFKSGNPLTLESIIYGIAAGTMLVSVICWFSCYNAVMSSDKFVYLFGRVIPSMSLILSMTLRLVPKFKVQLKRVSNAQKGLGRDHSNGGVIRRAESGLTILSAMVTWALENAVETADSMRSRGYGLPGRTAFSIYRFDRRDRTMLLYLLLCGGYMITGYCLGGLYWRCFPTIKSIPPTITSVSLLVCYFALCFTPLIVNMREDRKWIRLQSKI